MKKLKAIKKKELVQFTKVQLPTNRLKKIKGGFIIDDIDGL